MVVIKDFRRGYNTTEDLVENIFAVVFSYLVQSTNAFPFQSLLEAINSTAVHRVSAGLGLQPDLDSI